MKKEWKTDDEFYASYATPEWQKKRASMLSKSLRCELCNAKDQQLHIHHRFYRPGAKAWEYKNYELAVLCTGCHEFVHGRSDEFDAQTIRIVSFVRAIIMTSARPRDTDHIYSDLLGQAMLICQLRDFPKAIRSPELLYPHTNPLSKLLYMVLVAKTPPNSPHIQNSSLDIPSSFDRYAHALSNLAPEVMTPSQREVVESIQAHSVRKVGQYMFPLYYIHYSARSSDEYKNAKPFGLVYRGYNP